METNTDGATRNEEKASNPEKSDLPFLVTHWLSAYGNGNAYSSSGHDRSLAHQDRSGNLERQRIQDDALERIRKATSELASAFSDLGVFGYTFAVSLHV